MVCGGYYMTGCYVWDKEGWTKSSNDFGKRYRSASSVLEDGTWLVTGGYRPSKLSSTMLYSPTGGWKDHIPLPVATAYHCQVSLGSETFVMGGYVTGAVYKLRKGATRW